MKPSWRYLDADSDIATGSWKLSVKHREQNYVDTYLIHPEIVAAGPKRSEYLSSCYSTAPISINGMLDNSVWTILELKHSLARVVPLLLDFMYEITNKYENQSFSGMAAYELAELWGIPTFQKAIAQDRKKALTTTNVFPVLQFASGFGYSNPLYETVVEWCAEHLNDFSPSQAGRFEPHVLLEILRKNMHMPEGVKIDLSARSRLIVSCIKAHNHSRLLTKDLFYHITDEELLPVLNPRLDAPEFLLAEAKLSKGRETRLSNLQRRCVQSITSQWQECVSGLGKDDKSLEKFLKQLSPLVQAELLVQTQILLEAVGEMKSSDGVVKELVDAVEKKLLLDHRRTVDNQSAVAWILWFTFCFLCIGLLWISSSFAVSSSLEVWRSIRTIDSIILKWWGVSHPNFSNSSMSSSLE